MWRRIWKMRERIKNYNLHQCTFIVGREKHTRIRTAGYFVNQELSSLFVRIEHGTGMVLLHCSIVK